MHDVVGAPAAIVKPRLNPMPRQREVMPTHRCADGNRRAERCEEAAGKSAAPGAKNG
jgi:hypothetical protein